MRQITIDACEALLTRQRFGRSNTTVYYNDTEEGWAMRLHNTDIAIMNYQGLKIKTGGWNTVTTRERLNGLPNVHVYTEKGQQYLNGEPWDGSSVLLSDYRGLQDRHNNLLGLILGPYKERLVDEVMSNIDFLIENTTSRTRMDALLSDAIQRIDDDRVGDQLLEEVKRSIFWDELSKLRVYP